jgi:hypothetical protein
MNRGIHFIYLLVIILLIASCSGAKAPPIAPKRKVIEDQSVKFISVEALEKAGYEHIAGIHFRILFIGKFIYIFNTKDFLLTKFKGNRLQRAFKTRKGQAPKEMITPLSLFRYNGNTIALFDELKSTVFFFDIHLNLTKELKIKSKFEDIARVGKEIVATHASIERNFFALLDNNFQVVRTFVKANNTFPFKRVYKHHLNEAFFLGDNLVSHSYSMFLYKLCTVNIHDIRKGMLVLKLKWEQPFSPTAQSINKKENCYYLYHVGKYGSYYVVQTSHSRTLLGSRRHREFRIFDQAGEIKYKDDFSNRIIQASKETPDSKLYFMDDEEGISYIDIEEFMK